SDDRRGAVGAEIGRDVLVAPPGSSMAASFLRFPFRGALPHPPRCSGVIRANAQMRESKSLPCQNKQHWPACCTARARDGTAVAGKGHPQSLRAQLLAMT